MISRRICMVGYVSIHIVRPWISRVVHHMHELKNLRRMIFPGSRSWEYIGFHSVLGYSMYVYVCIRHHLIFRLCHPWEIGKIFMAHTLRSGIVEHTSKTSDDSIWCLDGCMRGFGSRSYECILTIEGLQREFYDREEADYEMRANYCGGMFYGMISRYHLHHSGTGNYGHGYLINEWWIG